MITRVDTLSYTLPLSYLLKEVHSSKAATLRKLYESVAHMPASKEYKLVLQKESGVWRSYSELVETNAHNFSEGYEAVLVWTVESILNDVIGLDVEVEQRLMGGKNNFLSTVRFNGGFVAFGGNNRVLSSEGHMVEVDERMQFYLDGSICERLTAEQWQSLYDWSVTINDLKITRCDICLDDHKGSYPVDYAHSEYLSGAFNTGRGRPPKAKRIVDVSIDQSDSDGETFYVGSRKSGKLIRIYEKGKQLGDSASDWVRWEVELLSKDRVIPLDVVVNSDVYFAGSYPACETILTEIKNTPIQATPISTGKIKTQIVYEHMKNHARRSYGRLINFMTKNLGLDPEQIVKELTPDDRYLIPARLSYLGRGTIHTL